MSKRQDHQPGQASGISERAMSAPLFEALGLPEGVCHALVDAAQIVRFPARAIVVTPDGTDESVGFVLDGRIRFSCSVRTGWDIPLVDRHAGELLGVLGPDGARPRRFRIAAVEPSAVAFVSCDRLDAALRRDVELYGRVLRPQDGAARNGADDGCARRGCDRSGIGTRPGVAARTPLFIDARATSAAGRSVCIPTQGHPGDSS